MFLLTKRVILLPVIFISVMSLAKENSADALKSADKERPTSVCANVTDGGEISENQDNCGPFVPETLESIEPASGGIGPVEYLWKFKELGELEWTAIPGSNNENYSPGEILETTLFKRFSKNEGCDDFVGESNEVVITILDSPLLYIERMDASCDGEIGGTATAIVTGGSAPYTYLWSGGETTAAVTDLPEGLYSVTIRDANSCEAEEEFEILRGADLDVSIGAEDIMCYGETTSATVTVSGGTAPYSYLWSTGATTPDVDDLSVGSYSVAITDANDCATTSTIEVTAPNEPLTASISAEDIMCYGETTSATVTVSGGASPYSYLWSNGQTTATATGLSRGTYTVVVTDANGCEQTDSFTVEGPTEALAGTVATNAVACYGDSSGSATILVTGGTVPYSYLWSNGQTTATATDLSAGTYSVVVTDANGCSISSDILEVVEPDGALGLVVSKEDIDCFGAGNGSATVAAVGGTDPYSYLWSTGATSATVTDLSAGFYTVTATDYNGCVTTEEIEIEEPEELVLVVSGIHVSCFGLNDGSATATVTGGASPYSYLWSNGQTTATAAGLSRGTYTVVVTDGNGCEQTDSFTVEGPTEALAGTVATNAVACYGDSSGSATILVTGGTVPYSYLWSNGQTTATATDLSAGTYSVVVTDGNGCSISSDILEVVEPDGALGLVVSKEDIDCFGAGNGSATVAAVGGTDPYSYLWSTGATSATVTDLSAGFYTVTATDYNGCVTTEEIEIEEPEELVLVVSGIHVSCFGLNDGSATATVTGGTAPYTYFWHYEERETSSIDGLPLGTYTVVVTDANGCEQTDSFTVEGPTEALAGTVATNAVACYGDSSGSATILVTGGTVPYSYLWSNGQTTATATDLSAGTYSVVVTDANGCSISSDILEVVEPDGALGLVVSKEDIDCFGAGNGSANVAAVGGTDPYSYLWSTGATSATVTDLSAGFYTVTATDYNGCVTTREIEIEEPEELTGHVITTSLTCHDVHDGTATVVVAGGTAPYSYLWNNGQTTPTITDLSSGTYNVTVTDVNGCEISEDFDGEAYIESPSPIELSVETESNICFGATDGEATVTTVGGVEPYSYLWSDGQTTATATDLSAGTYRVTVTDADGCVVEEEGVEIMQPDDISGDITITSPTCFSETDGEATVAVSGGTAPYSYLWSDGQTTPTAEGLSSGTYSVTITDDNSCEKLLDGILVDGGEELTADVDIFIGEVCDAFVTVTATGGTAPYTYEWEHGPTGNVLSSVCAGTYVCTITDANGCIFVTEVEVTYGIMPIAIEVGPNPISANGTIRVLTNKETNIVVDIVNDRGLSVLETLFDGSTGESGEITVNFDVGTLSRGVYMIAVMSDEALELKKIVVQ